MCLSKGQSETHTYTSFQRKSDPFTHSYTNHLAFGLKFWPKLINFYRIFCFLLTFLGVYTKMYANLVKSLENLEELTHSHTKFCKEKGVFDVRNRSKSRPMFAAHHFCTQYLPGKTARCRDALGPLGMCDTCAHLSYVLKFIFSTKFKCS